ncbi:MAG: SH3 domain-containing protein [Chloroflexota bacterium]|nr:SH3 domain-containing protein [Chloroflexota bacterium]
MIKAMQFSIMVWVFVLCNVASAQTYSIRVQFNTNLRSAASLDSQVLDSAPAGSVLQVLEHAGRWLKINRNGREVWMADWVSYSRVEDSAPAAPANVSPAQVDNCCFVDRQCNNAQDWDNGYWAFQNGQCAAPAPSQPQTSAKPVSNVPAQVDNCCFVDRQCQSDADWTDGYHAFQNNQCPATTVAPVPNLAGISVWTPNMTEGVKRLLANPSSDPFNNCCYMHHHGTCHSEEDWQRGASQYQNHQCIHPAPLWTRPVIVGNDSPLGTAKFTKLVNTALELMRVHTPEWLKYIEISGVREFELLPADVGGGFFNQSWVVGHGYYSWQQEDPNWEPNLDYIVGYAGGITHEACHAIQQRTYTQTVGWANELPCEEARLDVIATIKPDSKDVPWLSASVGHPDTWRR